MRLKRTLVPEPIDLDPAGLAGRLDWRELFPRAQPVEVEVGSGKGTFLVQEARARPDANFFGIEWMKKYAYYAADRCRRAGLDNVRTLAGDAAAFLTEHVPDASVRVVHVYHPDPWPKARHHKRRFVRPAVLEQLERVLEPGGELRIVTDHPEYAEWIAEVLATRPLEEVDFTRPASVGEGELVGTNFERKYRRRDGRPSFPFARRKPGRLPPAAFTPGR